MSKGNHFIQICLVALFFSGVSNNSRAQNFESSNLPIVVINTNGQEIVDEPKVTATMGIINNGSGTRNNLNDPYNEYDGFIGIELRGSSSRWIFPKKGFGLETRDVSGDNLNVELLGLPEENDWVLHGPYSDKSLIRNHLSYKLGRDLGRYASGSVPVELILNGEYWGLYMVMEKVKRDSNRVDIATLNPDEISGDDLTGGYIVKLDKFDGANSFEGWASPFRPPGFVRSDQEIYFQYHYPKNRDIVPQQQQYIREYVTTFEEALKSDMFAHPQEGYANYIDVDSFIDFLIMMEITRNVDGYRLSTFLYKDKDSKGGKLTLGPIWDFNLGFGNANYCQGWASEGWAYDFNKFCPEDFWLIPFWWDRLMEDPGFRFKLKSRWSELRSGVFSTSVITDYIDAQTSLLDEAQQRNFQKWPVLGVEIWPNAFVGPDYGSEIQFLKDWIQDRLEWLDANIGVVTAIDDDINALIANPHPNPFNDQVHFTLPSNSVLSIYNSLGENILQVHGRSGDFSWDAQTENGVKVQPGAFIFRITTNQGITKSGRIIRQ